MTQLDSALVAACGGGFLTQFDPQRYPQCTAAAGKARFFLLRVNSAVSSFLRSIAFSALNERDRQGQLAMCRSRYRASRRAKLILVPATVATAENVRGGLAQARPSGVFSQLTAP
jgi:hypothetical protein